MIEERKKIYIGGLEEKTSETEIKELIELETGFDVVSINIVRDKFTGRSKCFGFVEFENEEDTREAIEKLNGKILNEKKLRVNKARKRERSDFDWRIDARSDKRY